MTRDEAIAFLQELSEFFDPRWGVIPSPDDQENVKQMIALLQEDR